MAHDGFVKRQSSVSLPAQIFPSSTPSVSAPAGLHLTTDSGSAPAQLTMASISAPATTATPSAAAATSSAAAASPASDGGLPMPEKLAAIIAPIAFVIVLIPIIYMLWIRHRTRRNRNRPVRKPSPHSDTQAAETRLLRHSPQNSMFLPSPLNDSERIKSGSLGVFELRRSLEDQGRADSIGVFSQHPRSTAYTNTSVERGPSPTLPSPKVPAFNRPPSEAWPLPANGIKLPSPTALHNPPLNTNKALPTPTPAMAASSSSSSAPSTSYQHPSLSNPRDQNPDILSYASSDVLVAPAATWRRESSNYDLTPSTGTFPENVRPQPQQSQRAENAPPAARNRDSDLVSELSYREALDSNRKRDTDAISVVSAMTNDRRRRSEREDAMSVVSALSPEEPRIPIEHYPL